MAHFEVDRQTINDLQIFKDAGHKIAVYTFFDRVSTLGGSRKLTELMSTPSNDIRVLNSRRDCIKYFYDNQPQLRLDKNDLDFIEHYLAFNVRAISTNVVDAFAKGISYKFSHNNDYYVVTKGINDVSRLLRALWQFYNELLDKKLPLHITTIIENLKEFFAIKGIEKLIAAGADKKLNYFEIGYYDNLFRKQELRAMKSVINIVYELDAYIAIAEAATRNNFCFPEYCDGKDAYVQITELYHPCIKNAVKNNVSIDQEKNLVFLTGANMAGKSSFLKSLGLAVYLAHIGFPIPADSMQSSVFNGLITTINLSDNITNGYSHYYSEVKRVKETANKLLERANLFIVFDELFRGTNVKDAYAASLATIIALSKIRNSAFLISTHIVEIAVELKQYNNISFRYFASGVEDGKLIFEYKIREGISDETLGFFIFKNEGILEILESASAKESRS
jgi:DNA mismatch repair protein MutS